MLQLIELKNDWIQILSYMYNLLCFSIKRKFTVKSKIVSLQQFNLLKLKICKKVRCKECLI